MHRLEVLLINIPQSDMKDPQLMYLWLFERFRTWGAIKEKIEKIKDDPKLQIFDYLRNVVLNLLRGCFILRHPGGNVRIQAPCIRTCWSLG